MKVVLVSLLGGLLVAGCEKGDNGPSSTVVSVRLQKVAERLLDEDFSSTEYNKETFRQLMALPNREQQVKCLDGFVNAILGLELEGHSYRVQDRVLRHVELLIYEDCRVGAESGDIPWDFEYDIRIRYLSWLRNQIRRVLPFYKKEILNAPIIVTDACRQEEQDWCNRICRMGIANYENKLLNLERGYYGDRRHMTETERKSVLAKIETYLGRSIRTKKQLEEDFSNKRMLEFPGWEM